MFRSCFWSGKDEEDNKDIQRGGLLLQGVTYSKIGSLLGHFSDSAVDFCKAFFDAGLRCQLAKGNADEPGHDGSCYNNDNNNRLGDIELALHNFLC